jgi:hypothetical protein
MTFNGEEDRDFGGWQCVEGVVVEVERWLLVKGNGTA